MGVYEETQRAEKHRENEKVFFTMQMVRQGIVEIHNDIHNKGVSPVNPLPHSTSAGAVTFSMQRLYMTCLHNDAKAVTFIQDFSDESDNICTPPPPKINWCV